MCVPLSVLARDQARQRKEIGTDTFELILRSPDHVGLLQPAVRHSRQRDRRLFASGAKISSELRDERSTTLDCE